MQRSQRSTNVDYPLGRIIVQIPPWTVREMIFTPQRISWLWEQLKHYPSLTTDPTKGDPEQLWISVSSPQSFWTEVWEDSELVGILYASHIQPGVDALLHPIFFDRKLSEKVPICMAAMQWALKQFSLHRISVAIPEMYFATVRLAKKLGFTLEGTRREVYMINGRWCNELVFGLLASEIQDG